MARREKDLKPLKYDVPAGFDKAVFEKQWTKIIALNQERMLLERQLHLKNEEINAAWAELPATVEERRWLPCTHKGCHEKTQDRFGRVAICASHVAKGDEAIAAILADVFYGEDE